VPSLVDQVLSKFRSWRGGVSACHPGRSYL